MLRTDIFGVARHGKRAGVGGRGGRTKIHNAAINPTQILLDN